MGAASVTNAARISPSRLSSCKWRRPAPATPRCSPTPASPTLRRLPVTPLVSSKPVLLRHRHPDPEHRQPEHQRDRHLHSQHWFPRAPVHGDRRLFRPISRSLSPGIRRQLPVGCGTSWPSGVTDSQNGGFVGSGAVTGNTANQPLVADRQPGDPQRGQRRRLPGRQRRPRHQPRQHAADHGPELQRLHRHLRRQRRRPGHQHHLHLLRTRPTRCRRAMLHPARPWSPRNRTRSAPGTTSARARALPPAAMRRSRALSTRPPRTRPRPPTRCSPTTRSITDSTYAVGCCPFTAEDTEHAEMLAEDAERLVRPSVHSASSVVRNAFDELAD